MCGWGDGWIGVELTNVHVQGLSIPSLAGDYGCDDYELVFGDEVADAAFF